MRFQNKGIVLVVVCYVVAFAAYALEVSYPYRETVKSDKGEIVGDVAYDILNGKKLYSLSSIVAFPPAFFKKGDVKGPREVDFVKVFDANGTRIVVVGYSRKFVFAMLVDSANKYVAYMVNGNEIRRWTRAYAKFSNSEPDWWLSQYNLGQTFKSLSVADDKIVVITGDGGTGSLGGFNIRHVCVVKNGHPVVLVSEFVDNPEKRKKIERMENGSSK